MKNNFLTNQSWATLLPYSSGLRTSIPSAVALIPAIPLLVFAGVSTIAQIPPLQLLFGVPGILFLGLWILGRGVSKKFGQTRINRDTKEVLFTERDGSETKVVFPKFESLRIEKLVLKGKYTWMAILTGGECAVVLETGFISQKSLVERFTSFAEWLNIPIEISSNEVNGMKLFLRSDFRTNPYPKTQD